MQCGLGALCRRFDGDFGETVVQPRGAREYGLINEPAQFGVHDAGIDRVHRHSGSWNTVFSKLHENRWERGKYFKRRVLRLGHVDLGQKV